MPSARPVVHQERSGVSTDPPTWQAGDRVGCQLGPRLSGLGRRSQHVPCSAGCFETTFETQLAFWAAESRSARAKVGPGSEVTAGLSYGGFFAVSLCATRIVRPPHLYLGSLHPHTIEAMSDFLPPVSPVPQRATEVLEGLKLHAPRADGALRPPELARRLGLGSRIVASALDWLSSQPANGVVRRQKRTTETWDKFSFSLEGSPSVPVAGSRMNSTHE